MYNNILNEKKKIRRWWDDDGDNIGYESGEVSGRFKRKKKSVKEGFSNWRQDLSEVIGDVEKNDKSEDIKITEKEIKNNVKINPTLDEAVEQLGGTLLEMTEIEDFEGVFDELSESDIFFLTDDLIEGVVEEVFIESIQEGYDIFEIENTLLESLDVSSALLNEAKVTYGHDTDIKSDRLEKVKSAVKKVGKGILRGAGYVAGAAVRGAKAVGREFGSGYKRGRYGSGGSSGFDSSSSPTYTRSDSNSDSTDSGSSKPGLLSRIGSALKRGLKKVVAKGARAVSRGARNVARKMEDKGKKSEILKDPWEGSATTPSKKPAPKPQATTTTIPAKTSEPQGVSRKQFAAALRAQRRNINISPEKLQGVIRNVNEDYYDLASKSVRPGKPGAEQKKTIETLASIARTKKKTRKPVGTSRRGGSFKPSSQEEAEANKQSWGDYWSFAAKGYKEEYDLLEKAESKQQQKLFGLALSVSRGETPRSGVSAGVLKIVDTMSEKEIRKFAKTSHDGLPKKIQTKEEAIREALLDRMFEKIEEQGELYIDEAKLPSSMKKGKKTRESKTLKLTDCDDCTHNQSDPNAAKIYVLRPVTEEKKRKQKFKKVETLTPQQFAHHNLTPGDEYGFDEFKSTELVKKTTKPNKRIVNFLNREDFSMIDERIRRYPVVRGVTARGSMDDNRGFTQDMKSRIGVKNLKAVHFVGDIKNGSGPKTKATVAKHIVSKHPDAEEVDFVDDYRGNVEAVTDTLAKPGKTVKGKVGRTRETGPKVKGFVAKPATRSKGTVKAGEVVPVRLGGEGIGGNRGIRSKTLPSSEKTTTKTQKRGKQQKGGMGESYDDSGFR